MSPFQVRLKYLISTIVQHAKASGIGLICAVAYFDPGNWGVDLQAGSQFEYRLLFVVLLAGLFAILFQIMASRLGCVTGLDLASHCRLLFHSRPKHPLLWRYLILYPLYAISELAIIATDLAELLGSAIALCLLFPKLQLWHGVLITGLDVVLLLAMKDPLRGRPVRIFEGLIAILVLAVLICMCIIIARIDIDWPHAFQGYLPTKFIVKNNALYTSIGILGATVMPHSLFLGSALATQDRLSVGLADKEELSRTSSTTFPDALHVSPFRAAPNRLFAFIKSVFSAPPPSDYASRAIRHSDRENNSLAFVKAHMSYATVDIVTSLLGFAVVINSLILILAGAVFFSRADSDTASLFDAYNLILELVGRPAATLFAIALLAAGQSSSIIATVAGQAVSEGFLNWRVSPVVRRLLTRLIAIIPSMTVAIVVGRQGIDSLLIISQVCLSIVLPFVTLPLIWLTSSKTIMAVQGPDGSIVDFSNSLPVTLGGLAIWLLILIANGYVIINLIIGA
ncbi:natural resistance-associated macrophage protein-domain-containing protein [Mycena floridula]|nr:natural resistance-associated macrophage protein-domain-containing protein [Mycena floridula]